MTTPHESRQPPDAATTAWQQRVASQALWLQQAWLAGRTLPPLLLGRHFGLVCSKPDSVDATAFESAARELGAHVSRIQPDMGELLHDQKGSATAAWLGRLYDAIACQGLPPAVVERVRRYAGVPVIECARDSAAGDSALEGVDPMRALRCALQATMVAAFD